MIKEVRVRGVRKRYKYFELAVDDLVFRKGLNYVMGPNGSGKTTLLKILSGLIRPDEGEVTYIRNDGRVVGDPVAASSDIVYVGEGMRFPNIMVMDILESFAPTKDALMRVIKDFGLGAYLRKKYWELSSGFRRRVQIAVACLINPQVYMLDEPFASIDAGFVTRLAEMAEELGKEGRVVIVASHIMTQISGGNLVLLDQGRIVYNGEADPVIRRAYRFTIQEGNEVKELTWEGLESLIKPAKLL